MTEGDRTDELIAAMLARRAGQPLPDGLAERTVAAVATQRQVRDVGARRRVLPPVVDGRLAIVAGVAVLAAGLLIGALITGFRPGVTGPGGSQLAVTDVTPSSRAEPSSPSSLPASAPPSGPSATTPAALAPDTLAVVTRAGDRLRVRSAPGVGAESEKLEPLLSSGTRLLVIGGPVEADGYPWYEVAVEDQPDMMHGWVAAADAGTRWIRPTAAECRGEPDADDVAEMAPFDFLVCYHAQEVSIDAKRNEAQGGVDVECPWVGDIRCNTDMAWLLGSVYVTRRGADGTRQTIGLAVPDAVRQSMDQVPDDATMTLTVAMDAPEARSCRVTDPDTGQDLVAPNRIITACRLAFVVRSLTWEP
jgi:hypothetical protein